MKFRFRGIAALGVLSSAFSLAFADEPALPPLPTPLSVPAPGPKTDTAYAPQAILPGGVVVPLYPPDSPHLNQDKIREPEEYHWYGSGRDQIGYIVSIHNPSIEFHAGNGQLNTGVAIILAAGGGHRVLNVGGESADEVAFFKHHGISTIILRNRLRSDGYEPKTDGLGDALQAVKLVRAYAEQWGIDPNKIGIMGFSAGAELAAGAAMHSEAFDREEDVPTNPLAKVSSRPDFVGIIYPGPSPFAFGNTVAIPRDAPPAFFASAGWGDWIHAIWATEFFDALLKDGVPNIEMHLYARGHHPGDKVGPDEPPATGGVSNMGGIAMGKWAERYLDWMRDLGFLGKPGVETQAAKDVAAHRNREAKPNPYWKQRPPSATPAPAKTP